MDAVLCLFSYIKICTFTRRAFPPPLHFMKEEGAGPASDPVAPHQLVRHWSALHVPAHFPHSCFSTLYLLPYSFRSL